MKRIWTILIVFILSLNINQFVFSQSQPKAWYVYKNATGLNNGTSWQNAWTSWDNVNWSQIQAGDTIYISGGVDSLVYIANYKWLGNKDSITITKGKSPGHNGRVIIKPPTPGTQRFADIRNVRNWTISNLEFHEWRYGLDVGEVDGFRLENCRYINHYGNFFATGGDSSGTRTKNIWLVNNYFESVDSAYGQYETSINGTKNFYFIGNVVINRNNNPTTHDDFVQGDWNTNWYFINNYYQFDTTVTKQGNANGLSCSNHGGDWVAVNNVFVKNRYQINGNINHFYRVNRYPASYPRNWAKVLVANNTSIMYSGRQFVVDYDSQAVIKNNVMWVPGPYYNNTGTGLIYFIQSDLADDPDHSVDDYVIRHNAMINNWVGFNMQYLGGVNVPPMHSSNIFVQDASTTPGFVSYSLGNKDPQQFRLTSSSILRDAGETGITFTMHPDNDPAALNYLGSGKNLVDYFLERDFNGNLRDSQWDIGAFEYLGNQVIQDNDPPEVVSAQIIDSVTVRIVFSEPLEQSSANNPNNYVIDNGVNVNSVQFSGVVATLNTSIHSPGFYNVIVSNVTDTAGNTISAQQNSASYGYNPNPLPELLKFIPGRSNASAVADTAYMPEKTFDGKVYNSGDPTSRWTAQYLPQWVSYDLGNVIMLNKTRIQFYNWQNGRIYNYTIQVSTDSVNWTDVRYNIPSQLAEWTVETFEPTPARFVKIIVLSNNQNSWVSIWEAEFYGQLMVSNDDETKNIPTNFVLNQNYPNPFNPTTTISWQSPVSGRHTIKLFDMLGREIETIVDDYFEAGKHSTLYIVNSELPSGVYFYQLRINDPSTSSGFSTRSGSLSSSGFSTHSGGGQGFVETKKMILLK